MKYTLIIKSTKSLGTYVCHASMKLTKDEEPMFTEADLIQASKLARKLRDHLERAKARFIKRITKT